MNRSAPRSIDQYLRQLREELAGADSALIQDALYDAEEYLRAEVAAHPDKSESDVLELIASTYGAPDEVASAYRDTEIKVKAAMATPRKNAKSPCGRVFRRVSGSSRLYVFVLHVAVAGHRHHLLRLCGGRPVAVGRLRGAGHRRAVLSDVHGGEPRCLAGGRATDRGDDRRAHAAAARLSGQRPGILGADRSKC